MSTPSIEDVLAAHQHWFHGTFSRCECGDWEVFMDDAPDGDSDLFRAHLADAIRAHLAEHTDEAAGAVERVRITHGEHGEPIARASLAHVSGSIEETGSDDDLNLGLTEDGQENDERRRGSDRAVRR